MVSEALRLKKAKPLVLAAGDFDADGVTDLVSGYATSTGGLIALHKGSPASGSTNTSSGGTLSSPFQSPAMTFGHQSNPVFLVWVTLITTARSTWSSPRKVEASSI